MVPTQTRFDTEAKGNSGMAYLLMVLLLFLREETSLKKNIGLFSTLISELYHKDDD